MYSHNIDELAKAMATQLNSRVATNPNAPTPDKVAATLEASGWLCSVAGEENFTKAVNAIVKAEKYRLGLIVAGGYGVGKTSLMNIVVDKIIPENYIRVDLGIPDELDKFTPEWQEMFNRRLNSWTVFLDDMGAEKQVNEYGVKIETVGDFIVTWHARRSPSARLFGTMNLTDEEFDARYGGRVSSRLKDLCIPLHLKGKDKRRWQI